MPNVNGKSFPYTIKGVGDAQKMLQTLGQEREADKLEETKSRIRQQKRISAKKAPVKAALRNLGYIQTPVK